MGTVGIIVEYNPLHNGHVHHFEQSMQASGADACVAVMSGNFLQRGEPAIVNKWARTEMALRMGVDLVIELPVAYASQPAEWFAYGAVRLLQATGVVDDLCFGSEDGRIEPLERLAGLLVSEPETLRNRLKAELKKGVNYPAAFAAAVASEWPEAPLLTEDGAGSGQAFQELRLDLPNNILGLHYLIALRRLNSRIRPLTIPRRKAGYHEQEASDESIASATAIRKLIFDGGSLNGIEAYVPAYTLDILRRERDAGRAPMDWEHYWQPLLAQLAAASPEQLSNISEMTEGLEHRIIRALRSLSLQENRPVEHLLDALKTKRYTHTKLQRTLLRVLLQHPKHDLSRKKLSEGLDYIRILGFSSKGRELLKRMKTAAELPVVTKVARTSSRFLDMDIRATSVYSLGYGNRDMSQLLRDYYEAPLHLDSSGTSLLGSLV